MKVRAPLYVKIDKYREVEETIAQIKAKIEEAREILNRLNEARAREEHDIHTWQQKLSDIEGKVLSVKNSMEK